MNGESRLEKVEKSLSDFKIDRRLIHYSAEEFQFENYTKYPQFPLPCWSKPNGRWVSVEGEDDWKNWCTDVGFQLENIKVSYELKINQSAKIIHIKTAKQIHEFTQKYITRTQFDPREQMYSIVFNKYRNFERVPAVWSYSLDWLQISQEYQGIIISPYQWTCRMHNSCYWYYGWDCASGCVWDLDCIEEFNILPNE